MTTPYVTDGLSMLAVARQGDRGWNRPVLTESTPRQGETQPSVRGIRTPAYFYTRWVGGEEELFNIAQDAAERHNVAGDPQYAATLALLRTTLASVSTCSGEACSPQLAPGSADVSR